MTRSMATTLVALLALTLSSGSILRAHEGHDHTVMGTVTMAAADHVMLKTTDGKDMTIQVSRDTKVTRNRQAMKVQDIKAGTRVVVTAIEENEQMKAKDIQVGAEARSAGK